MTPKQKLVKLIDSLRQVTRYDCENVDCIGGWDSIGEMVENAPYEVNGISYGGVDYIRWDDVQKLIEEINK